MKFTLRTASLFSPVDLSAMYYIYDDYYFYI